MITTSFPVASLFALAVLIAGCSSSRETAAPGATSAVSGDSQVSAILESSCYQCHSTNGTAPWYAKVSPTYLAANSARAAVNFSDWQTYDAEKKAAALKSIEEAVSAGSMPPGDYTALDHAARLSDDQKQALLKWASQTPLPAH